MALEDLKSAQGLIQFTGQTPAKKTVKENRNFGTRPISETQNNTVLGDLDDVIPITDPDQLNPWPWGEEPPAIKQSQNNNPISNQSDKSIHTTSPTNWDQFNVYGDVVQTLTSNQQRNDTTTLDVNSSPAETKGLQNDSNFMPTEWDDFNVYNSPLSTMASGQGKVMIPGNTSNISRQAATINRGTSAGGNNLQSNIFPNIKEPLAGDK